jgi:phosphoribosylformylglycinamidine synthase
MWELSESIDGMAEACNDLNLPVIGGNVSLYNESGGNDIDPTPVMGLLGVIDHLIAPPPGWNWRYGDTLMLVGGRYAYGDAPFPLGGSRWATRRHRRGGHLTGVKPEALHATLPFVTGEVASICAGHDSDVTAVHDVAGGGLATALAEMVAVTRIGARVGELDGQGELFSEFPGRFVVATSDPSAFLARAELAGAPVAILGVAGGDRLTIGSAIDLSVEEIASRRAGALVDALEAN